MRAYAYNWVYINWLKSIYHNGQLSAKRTKWLCNYKVFKGFKMNLSFALSDSRLLSDNFSVKKEAKTVTTKKWCKDHKDRVTRFASMLFNNGTDKNSIIKTMLVIGYGDNIGKQVFSLLDDKAIDKIASNLKGLYS